MKFSKQTIDILKNFSQINSSIMLTKGSFIMTKSLNSVVYAEAQISDVIDEDVGIYDLNSFLNMINLIGVDSEIVHDITTGEIIIRGDKTKTVERATDATTIAKPKKRLEMPVADLVFKITASDLDKLIKASRMMKLTEMSVEPIDGKLIITAKSKDSASTFSVEVGDYEGDNVFNFDIKIDNMQFINSDYKVEISAKGAAKFTSESGNGVAYVVVLESSSQFK